MKTTRLWWWSIAAVMVCGLLASGCADDGDDEGDPGGSLFQVVVQETNGPVIQTVFECPEGETLNQREVTRTCDGSMVRLMICTVEPLCDAVMDAAAAQVTACEVEIDDGTGSGDQVEVPASCP